MFNNPRKPKNNDEKKSWDEKKSSYSFMLHKISSQAAQKPVNTAAVNKSASINVRPEVTGQEQEDHNVNAPRPAARTTKSK